MSNSLADSMIRVNQNDVLTKKNLVKDNDFVKAVSCIGKVVQLPKDAIGKSFVEIAVMAGICKSKSEARRLIANGGLYACEF